MSAALGAVPPKAIPDIDPEKASVSVVVATSTPGGDFPVPKECEAPDIICMRFPLWFNVTILAEAYGAPAEKQLAVTTYTHYGQPEADDASSPRLMLLLTQNGETLMPVYANTRLYRRKDGEYFILLYSPYPVHWLPCGIAELREPVVGRDFPARIKVPMDDYHAKKFPDLYIHGRRTSVPRSGISVAKIQQYLAQGRRSAKDFRCESQDES